MAGGVPLNCAASFAASRSTVASSTWLVCFTSGWALQGQKNRAAQASAAYHRAPLHEETLTPPLTPSINHGSLVW
jgi:hypothetical protein